MSRSQIQVPPRLPLAIGGSLNEIDLTTLTDGRTIEQGRYISTDLRPDLLPRVNDVSRSNVPTTCGCIVVDATRLKQCSSCGGLACCENNHTIACEACRLWACVRCQVWTELQRRPVVLCPSCADRLTTPLVVHALRWVMGERR